MFLQDITKMSHVDVEMVLPIAKVLLFLRFLSKDENKSISRDKESSGKLGT